MARSPNRKTRRRLASINKHNGFYDSYVRHLPEVGPKIPWKPGVTHMVVFHDVWCGIYDGKVCNCDPHVKLHAEPRRS